jgi:hypothetical protein
MEHMMENHMVDEKAAKMVALTVVYLAVELVAYLVVELVAYLVGNWVA